MTNLNYLGLLFNSLSAELNLISFQLTIYSLYFKHDLAASKGFKAFK